MNDLWPRLVCRTPLSRLPTPTGGGAVNAEAVIERVVVWRQTLTNDLTRVVPVARLTCGHELLFHETDMSEAARQQHIGFELACPACAGHADPEEEHHD